MRKIFSIFLILFSFSASAQWLRPNNSFGTISNGAHTTRALIFPTGCGTPPTLSSADSAQLGFAIYGDSCNNKAYLYNPGTKSWSVIGSGTGGSGIDSTSTSTSGDTTFLNLYKSGTLLYSYYWQGDGAGGGGGSYHLPYNGISTNYLGGDTAYHALPSTPSLQAVTDVGYFTTHPIAVINSADANGIGFINPSNGQGIVLELVSGVPSMNMSGGSGSIRLQASNATGFSLIKFPNVSGTLLTTVNGVASDVNGNVNTRLKSYTVSTLPSSPTQGDEAAVTDATSPTYLGALTGGGSTYTPCVFNGTIWISH